MNKNYIGCKYDPYKKWSNIELYESISELRYKLKSNPDPELEEMLKIKENIWRLLVENNELHDKLDDYNSQLRNDMYALNRAIRENKDTNRELRIKFKRLLIAIPLIWTALTVISSLLG